MVTKKNANVIATTNPNASGARYYSCRVLLKHHLRTLDVPFNIHSLLGKGVEEQKRIKVYRHLAVYLKKKKKKKNQYPKSKPSTS